MIKSSAFVSLLEITDARYDLSCYGGFLKDVPRRLGTGHDALDASVHALTSCFSLLYTGQRSLDPLLKYGNALKALRICMGDPIKARTPDTLCAIYLITICNVSSTPPS
jgi:hypothetical protein